MKGVVHEIQPLLEEAIFDRATAVSERKLILHFKDRPSLLLCFQEPFLRFHLTKHPWKDHPQLFSKQLTQALHRWHLTQCELLQEDRILQLVFKKGDERKKLICEFIPKKTNCHLVDGEQQILTSLYPVEKSLYILSVPPVQTSTSSQLLSSEEIEEVYLPLEWESDFNEKKQWAETQLKKQLKQMMRAKDKLSQDLNEALNWEKVQHEATLLQSNLYKIKKGMQSVHVNDWLQDNVEVEIVLDPMMTPAEEIAKRFQKSKKLKRGIEPLKRQLEQTSKKEEKIALLVDQLAVIDSENELKIFFQKNYLSPSQKLCSKKAF